MDNRTGSEGRGSRVTPRARRRGYLAPRVLVLRTDAVLRDRPAPRFPGIRPVVFLDYRSQSGTVVPMINLATKGHTMNTSTVTPAAPTVCPACGQAISRATAGQGPWECVNCSWTEANARLVAIRHNDLNTSIYRVTPLDDGMELVEYVAHIATADPETLRRVEQAKAYADVTGSKSATYREEGPGGVLVHETTWHRNPFALRLVQGVHRAKAIVDPAQAALAAEYGQNPRNPAKGDRFVVSELSGYQLAQDRPLAHRDCHCGNGATTYFAGVVEDLTWWADNSVDVAVRCEDGKLRTVQTVAPRGDVCF